MKEFNITKIEISPKQIFEQMKSNIYKSFSYTNYSHINKEYVNARKTLFNILRKITNLMGFKSQTFFLTTHYLDIIFNSKENINMNINLVGLAALCLSSKFCENDPVVPHLQYFIKVYNLVMSYKNIISMKDLKSAEILLLKILNYKLNYYTVYDFNSFFFGHGILKFEQIKDIGNYNKNLPHYRNKRNEFIINQINSIIIKNLLEKIYKKSRLYLDIITYKTKLCLKYNSLFLSIYVMQKSVIEILEYEHKIFLRNKKEQEEFYKRNSLCFKEIMLEFYNIEYENNEEYKQLINDEEIQEIFEKKIKIKNEIVNPSCITQIEEKKENETENNINKNNNNNDNKHHIFTSSVSNGFYKRINLNINMEELYKKQYELNERNTLTSRNKKSDSKSTKNKTLDNIEVNKMDEPPRNYKKRRDIIKNYLIKADKSAYNINSSEKDINKRDSSIKISTKLSNISINKKIIPKIETYNNFNNRKTISNIKPSENTNLESKYSITKETDIISEKNSPIKLDEASNNNNISIYSRINKFNKINRLNNGKERNDCSFSITENYNSELNKISCDKKPYFRKLIHQNTIENYSILNFNSTNKNINAEKIKFDINNRESSNRNKNLKIISKYYTRINLKKPNNDVLDTSININDNTYRNNNILNDNQLIITARYRRRLNNITSNNTNNNINDISEDIKKENSIIIKDNNIKKEIESYEKNKLSHNKGLTSLNFYKNSRNKESLKFSKNLDNSENKNNESYKSFVEPKRFSCLFGKQNAELNNTLKEINKALAKNKKEETINEYKEKDKEKNKDKDKDKEKGVNSNLSTSNINNSIKVNFTKSIRQKYLNINKSNKNYNNINKNINTVINNNNDSSNKKIEIQSYNIRQSNSNNISIKNRYSSKNQNNTGKISYNLLNNKNSNNNSNNKTCDNIKSNDNNNDNNNKLTDILEKEDLNNKDYYKTRISFYKKSKETKALNIEKTNNKEEDNKNIKDNIDCNKINNKTNVNFYKTQNNYIKAYKTEKNLDSQRNKEEMIKNQQDKKIGNNLNFRNILYKNKINKNKNNNITNIDNKSQKNISDIDINNNNIENKNTSNQYVRYRNIYRKNNVHGLNLDNSLLDSKNDDNKCNINKNDINNNINNVNKIANNVNSKKHILNSFHYYRKTIDKVNNNNGNYKTSIFNKNNK